MSLASSVLAEAGALLLLRPAPFILGELVLTGHEVPGRISIGGAQAVTIHKMPGGTRIIDAMGADPGAITWRGVFVGPGAVARARTVDFMRQQGTPRVLSFGDYTLSIVIVHYEYDYQDQGAVIAYRIRGEIVPGYQNTDSNIPTIDFAVQGDLSVAQNLLQIGQAVAGTYAGLAGSRFGAASAGAADTMVGISAGLAITSSLSDSATVGTSAGATLVQIGLGAAATTLSNSIDTVSGTSRASNSDGPGFVSASALAGSTAQAAALAALVRAGGYVNRANSNLASVNAQALGPLVHS